MALIGRPERRFRSLAKYFERLRIEETLKMEKIYLRVINGGDSTEAWVLDTKKYNAHSLQSQTGVIIQVQKTPFVDLKEEILKKIERIESDEDLERLNSILDRGGFLRLGVSEEEFNSRDC